MTDAGDRVLAEADAWLDAGRPAEALDRLRPVVAARPGDPAVLVRVAAALHALSRTGEALDAADRAVAAAPSDPAALGARYAALLALARYAEAAQVADLLVAADPSDPTAHVARAVVDVEADRVDDRTEQHARTALALDPGDLDHHVVVGVVAEQRGDTATAARAFAHVLAHRPDSVDARLGLARLAGDGRDRDAQVQHLAAVGRRDPRSAVAGTALVAAFLRVTGRTLLLLTLAGLLAVAQRTAQVAATDPDRSAAWTTASVSTVVIVLVAALTAVRSGPTARRAAAEAVRALPLVRLLVASEVIALATVWVSAALQPAWLGCAVAVLGFVLAVGLTVGAIVRSRRHPAGWLAGSRFEARP